MQQTETNLHEWRDYISISVIQNKKKILAETVTEMWNEYNEPNL